MSGNLQAVPGGMKVHWQDGLRHELGVPCAVGGVVIVRDHEGQHEWLIQPLYGEPGKCVWIPANKLKVYTGVAGTKYA
jgi:hypothetical protein